ncbi:hypothetical protein CALVIDRAFT_597740 [Calocera viscosa TUFC12733]|uniref:Borealin N-terminal domain-containing protein n=1 Tax=Calocera viscosa (strain TUFC12733) TaxID=1330018 RepID=A0A167MRT0_CALVF|nr:hypothetical protein CALVIDRAFT_597740 [Calocera viscosa TUFC12733]
MDVETPRATRTASTSGYSYEEKQSILENLDIEVADKKRRFDDYLDRLLKSFLLRQESEVTRIPRSLRGMTIREFGEKYNGDIKYCMETMARERLGEEGLQELDASAKKRKRQEYPHEQEMENTKPNKTPRRVPPSAKKPAQTPSRTPARGLFGRGARSPLAPRNGPDAFRPAFASTPLKPSASAPLAKSTTRPPTARTFNPLLPSTPAFPRKVKRNESLMSVNGSPLENPYDYLGLDVESSGELEVPKSLKDQLHAAAGGPTKSGLPGGSKRTSISLRREPSLLASTAAKAKPTALLSVPTKDGHIIEFDPLITSPAELDELEGITDSARKKAREDMVKLVQQTLSKWTL